MLARRLLTLVVVLLGLTVLAVSVAPRDASFQTPIGSPTPAPVEPDAEPPAATAAPVEAEPAQEEAEASGRGTVAAVRDLEGEPPLHRVDAQGIDQHVRVRVGERVRIAVSSREPTAVQIGVDGPLEPVDPQTPAQFDLMFPAPSERPIQLVQASAARPQVVGTLEVVAE